MVLLQRPGISSDIQRTVNASILHAVQDSIQSLMAANIEALSSSDQRKLDVPAGADETALYRISGWALKSCIDNAKKNIKPSKQLLLDLLLLLKRPMADKETLPKGVLFLDRGGMTFVHSWLLPWLNRVEQSIAIYLSQTGYARYGKDVFQITKDSVVKDSTLLQTFTEALQINLDTEFPAKITGEVHEILLTKFYNARCNEFLKNISKLSCIKSKKAVDVNVSLRDKLKCYAAEKQTMEDV